MSRRNLHSDTDSKRFYDWLQMASEDMVCATVLSGEAECYCAAAFHCQQAIEKALKAYILLKSDVLVDGHNLSWLIKRAMRYDKHFAKWLDESAFLNRCYIETRYPADIPLDIGKEDVQRYLSMSIDMYKFICSDIDEALKKGGAHPEQRGR